MTVRGTAVKPRHEAVIAYCGSYVPPWGGEIRDWYCSICLATGTASGIYMLIPERETWAALEMWLFFELVALPGNCPNATHVPYRHAVKLP